MERSERHVYVFECDVCGRPHIAFVRLVEMSCCKKQIKTFRIVGVREAQKLSKDWEKSRNNEAKRRNR